VDLSFRRWAVEEEYKDETVTLPSETVHRQPPNGIRQEGVAARLMPVMARTRMIIAQQAYLNEHQRGYCKQAILALAAEAARLVPKDPKQALGLFTERLQEIARGQDSPPAKLRSSQPRLNQPPVNKWSTRNRNTVP